MENHFQAIHNGLNDLSFKENVEWSEIMAGRKEIPYLDMHVSCEPLRMLTEPFSDLKGNTMFEKRSYFKEHFDSLRTLTLCEPRGHDDNYGALITPPLRQDSAFGVLFMYSSGMSPMCGHGTIAIARAAVDLGLIDVHEGRNEFLIDVPASQIRCIADVENGEVIRTGFDNDVAFTCALDKRIIVKGVGTIPVEIGYGGAFMVFVRDTAIGVDLEKDSVQRLVDIGIRCRDAFMEQINVVHPRRPDIQSGDEGICLIMTSEPRVEEDTVYTRCFTVFGERQYDRSPTGTGTSALAAILYEKGILKENGKLVNIGPGNIPFEATVRPVEGGVIPRVLGRAFITARGSFILEDSDPVREGYTGRK